MWEATRTMGAVGAFGLDHAGRGKSTVQSLNFHFNPRQRDIDACNQVGMQYPLFTFVDSLTKNPPGVLRCDRLAFWDLVVAFKWRHYASLVGQKREQIF